MDCEALDTQVLAENVSFLNNCFDNSFNVKCSLIEVKEYVSQQKESYNKCNVSLVSTQCKKKTLQLNSLESSSYNTNVLTKSSKENNDYKNDLKNWGLPNEIVIKYAEKGIHTMFDWQVECLSNPKVLFNCKNLVYSAPTSAGKTLVAEILTIKTVLERQKKVIVILPFVSIVREKMFYLQHILSSSGIRVEGFMGSLSPPGGLQAVHIAICTIEKANSLVNKMLDDKSISDLGAIIVDELHLLGDPHRGYILELLLTKVKYISAQLEEVQIQIIGMSATLPNLEVLSNWLDGELYVTEFRPIPLDEFCLVDNKYFDKNGKLAGTVEVLTENNDSDNVLNICLDTIKDGCSVLIFCMTKSRCENLAQCIASSFFKLGCSDQNIGLTLREQLKTYIIGEVLEQLTNCPVGLDQVLKNVISFGVAYHHAGLTFDERDIIEGAFKSGAIRVLVATSTLSSGVNLPARRVIIRSPVFQRQPINILTYKQMVGRAGRMGKDTKGESILICTKSEQKAGFDLMMGNLDPVKSCIECEDKFMRAVIEMIASQAVCTKAELELYSKCTLLFNQSSDSSPNSLLKDTLKQLIDYELIRFQKVDDEERYVATSLGKACLSSSMAPNDGLSLFCELQKARQCIVLETDLHLIYLVTPYSVSSQWADLDWLHLLTLWESLTIAMKRVGELVGVQESFIIRCLRGGGGNKAASIKKLNVHKRFYTALALQDLVNEVPLPEVAAKFQCARGFLQGLQQAAATFAGMVTAFSRQLGWKNMELLISQFQDRLHFGVHSELLELMKLTSLNGVRARTLYNAGFETISSIASADVNFIENALHKAVPFQSEKGGEEDDDTDVRKRNKIRNIWITGYCGMTAREAAKNLILEARNYLQLEIGVKVIKWEENTIQTLHENPVLKSEVDTVSKVNDDEIKIGCSLKSENKLSESILTGTEDELETESTTENVLMVSKAQSILESECKIRNNINENKDVSVLKEEYEKKKEELTVQSKEPDILWDSLQINETALDNISKFKLTAQIVSPNISFGELEDIDCSNKSLTCQVKRNSKILKDISLFSSEGDNSSLFEDSLPIDSIPNTVIDTKMESQCEKTSHSDYLNINSSSILEAFKTTVVDNDENIRLFYVSDDSDDDVDNSKDIKTENIEKTLSQAKNEDNEEISTQEVKELWVKKDFISPLKRTQRAETFTQPLAKKKKVKNDSKSFLKIVSSHNKLKMKSRKSKVFNILVNNENLECYILRESDIIRHLNVLHSSEFAGLVLLTTQNVPPSLIGNTIFNNIKKSEPSTYAITIYSPYQCIFLDLSSIDIQQFTLKFKETFTNTMCKIRSISVMKLYLDLMNLLKCELNKIFSDVLLSEWLIKSEEGFSSFQELAKKYCDLDLSKTKIIVNSTEKSYNKLDKIEDSCLKAWLVFNVAAKQEKFLLDRYQFAPNIMNLENQILRILALSEYQGIMVDKELASQLLIDVKSSQEVLQKKAYKICGYHFNFNSSKDVAKLLGIYRGRKVSTKKSVLTAHNSPMASIVIYWRKLNSILTKTLYPLTEKAHIYSKENRINPSYTMFTCTGRISMHEPNLQNVPRMFSIPLEYLELGDFEPCDDVIEFNCRNIFKASPGSVFVSADYCQLEMRILTHYSKDAVLTRIMAADVDVFKSIAASWGGIPESQVDDDLRQKAKKLCYGILYGMGNRTLSQHLDVSEMEAAVFMDSFYKTYPEVKKFTQNVIDECRCKGFVETLMKRRRYLPDINSQVPSKRCTAERQAVNTTIQGSAADIAKAAMCAVDNHSKPHLILQMHDELIYEVPEANKAVFIKLLKRVMETTISLHVPLPVKVRCGKTWGSLEEVI
ncbi:DNA polymerase theta [Pieris brassicae]|uniref:DNA polymerase theta n=1 Tax=Pieris brassicae TaxID=7116 RepID=UPI001E6614B2|nr:DNA polymerase theta [Pieris brassicae]